MATSPHPEIKASVIAGLIWFYSSMVFSAGCLTYVLATDWESALSIFIVMIVSLIGSLPILLVLLGIIPVLQRTNLHPSIKIIWLTITCIACCGVYGAAYSIIIYGGSEQLKQWLLGTTPLAASSLLAIALISKKLLAFFKLNPSTLKQHTQMDTSNEYAEQPYDKQERSNKILVKSLITGLLILAMLIPTLFISNLVTERQERQSKVTSEVSDRWAKAQVLSGPYIYLPYKFTTRNTDKKVVEHLDHVIIIPDNLDVKGQVFHELRLRSIYKVLLYKAALHNSGNFDLKLPKDIDKNLVQWQDAKICYSLSDFKGIEERLVVNFNGSNYELSPGLPSEEISKSGLSATVPLNITDEGKKLAFNMNLKIKGSEQLHFVPLSGDSRFTIRSGYPNPSFDGNNLPSVRTITDSGFTASWNFNKANLPFGTVLKDFKFDLDTLAFGVTLVQPADGYAKTNRCIKYAILFIGLTFSLFLIIELMQKKPLHPVQYILVGLALVIFYTLLLSISEFVTFDISYLIAALATILLITAYSYGHFRSSKTAAIFGGVLALLYSFTFVLIRLEDTALLIGSIGLFIILALAMYASRKINWYGESRVRYQV